MADWTGTIAFNEDRLKALDAFIHEPDTRTGDIFDQGSVNTDRGSRLDWIIKHDIFQGVVVHFSLMTEDGSAFLAGDEGELERAQDLLQTYTLQHEGASYAVTVTQA